MIRNVNTYCNFKHFIGPTINDLIISLKNADIKSIRITLLHSRKSHTYSYTIKIGQYWAIFKFIAK